MVGPRVLLVNTFPLSRISEVGVKGATMDQSQELADAAVFYLNAGTPEADAIYVLHELKKQLAKVSQPREPTPVD